MADTYYVVVKGIQDGFDKSEVIPELAQLFKTSEQDIRSRLLQSIFIVKRHIDDVTAKQYKSALEERGCIVDILPETTLQAESAQIPDAREPIHNAAPATAAVVPAVNPVMPSPGRDQSFAVRFGISSKYLVNAPNSFKYYGVGKIEISQTAIKISGKRHRLFWFSAPQQHEFANSIIRNARSAGKYVRFEIDNLGSKAAIQIGFSTTSIGEAAEIASLLPNTKTEVFAKEQAELEDFKSRLDQLSPHAPITPIIVGLNILVFVLMAFAGAGVVAPNPEVVIDWGSNFGPMTLQGQWWRLFTSTFIHFGIMHLLLNMVALYQTGRMVERMLGSYRYLLLYVFAGLTGSATSLLWNPMVNSAGASGAIFGVFGGLLVFMLRPKYEVPASVMNEHRNSTMIFIGFNLINGFSHSGIDNGAHIGGLLGGMLIAFLLARPINIDVQAQTNGRQWIIACLAATLTFGLMGLALKNPSDNNKQEIIFAQARLSYKDQEDEVMAMTKKIVSDHKPTTEQEAVAMANALEADVLPKWEQLYQLISQASLSPDSKSFSLQQLLLKFLADKRDSTKFLVDGIKNNDPEMIRKSGELTRDANMQVENIKQLKPK